MRARVGSGPPLGKSVASAGSNAGEVCLEEVASELGLPGGVTCLPSGSGSSDLNVCGGADESEQGS